MMIKRERGFTLVEVLIGVAITGLIVGLLGTSIYQAVASTEYGSDKMSASHDLQNVAYWFDFDGQRARDASADSELVLSLPDGSSVTYSVVGTELQRTAGESQMTLADNISDVSFSVENRMITMDITSSPEGRWGISNQGIYKVSLRPTEELVQ